MSDTLTRRLLRTYEQDRAPTSFFTRQYQSPPENFHDSESVEVDILRNDEEIAIAITDLTQGARMNAEDIYTNKRFIPPIFNEGFTINAWNTIKRQPGRNAFMDPRFQATASGQFLKGMGKVENKIRRAIEKQGGDVLQTGTLTLYDASGTAIYTIDYKPKATHFPTAGTAWNATGATISADVKAVCDLIRSDGQADANMLQVGVDAWNAMQNDDDFMSLFEARRADFGRITFMRMDDSGGEYHGIVNIGSYNLELWTYNSGYTDPQTGVWTRYLDPARCIVRAERGRLDMTFGSIPIIVPPEQRVLPFIPANIRRTGGGMNMTTNSYVSVDNKNLFGEVGTRPLAQPTAIDTFGCIETGV